MTQNQRNRLIAVVTTITVHAVVLFILASIVIKSEPVKEEFGGVFVQVYGRERPLWASFIPSSPL